MIMLSLRTRTARCEIIRTRTARCEIIRTRTARCEIKTFPGTHPR